jgi:hypothetical protein
VVPAGLLLLTMAQPFGTRLATLSKFSLKTIVVAEAFDAASTPVAAMTAARTRRRI